MNEKYDDPMLTAYALGELEGDERAAVETMLEKDPAARAVVDEIRASAAELASVFDAHAETDALALTDTQRAALRESAEATVENARPAGRVVSLVQRGAVAAGLLAMVGVGGWAVLSKGDRDDGGERFVRVGDEAVMTRDAIDTAPVNLLPADHNSGDHHGATDSAIRQVVVPRTTTTTAVQGVTTDSTGAKGSTPRLPSENRQQREKSKASIMTITPQGKVVQKPAAPSVGAVDAKNAKRAIAQGANAVIGTGGGTGGGGPAGAPPAPRPVFALGRLGDGKTPVVDGYQYAYRGVPGQLGATLHAGTPAANPAAPGPQSGVFFNRNNGQPQAQPQLNGSVVELDRYLEELKGKDRATIHDQRRLPEVVDSLNTALERRRAFNTEAYGHIVENAFDRVEQKPLSTFSIDVDTASYANVRRFLTQNTLPPSGALRIEECVNYFRYRYADPVDGHPFSTNVEVASCPWKHGHRLVRIGLKGREIPPASRPASNFVFLIDVSGSMRAPNKLGLVKQAMRMLVKQFDERDRVAIAVYAGASGLTLPSTPCNESAKIFAALDRLNANGSTNGAAGIKLAYQVAVENFVKGGNNRVILCTDGDFNVGVSSNSELVDLISDKAKSGVFLSILGFGSGNLKDDKLEAISGRGNGNYHYIDSMQEARKVLGEQLSGTLITIAKDVKIQVEFNPRVVQSYRLLGYENRMLAAQDFNDDTKDAGEIGAGHTVTALYEVVPVGAETATPKVDKLKFQAPAMKPTAAAASGAMLNVKLRYKLPESDTSTKLEVMARDHGTHIAGASQDFRFATAVAGFCMVLRNSAHRGNASLAQVIELAETGLAGDESGRRKEFVELAKKAQALLAQKK